MPGRRRAEAPNPNALIAKELAEATARLATGWPAQGHQTDWTGTPGLISHLAAPGEPPRAVFWLSDGHLNRYLYFACKGDWQSASRHAEPGTQVDRQLVAGLGLGPFSGGSDVPFVNGRMYFGKDGVDYFADFGPTGRLIRLGGGQ